MDHSTSFCAPFLEYMSIDATIDEGTAELITANCREIEFPKGHILLQEGNKCKHFHFIVSGQARAFYTDSAGKTITWMFHFNDSASHTKNLFPIDYKSFLTRGPATLNIEALTAVKVIQFSKEEVDRLFEHSIIFERWMRKTNEKAFIVVYDRVFTLLTMSAAQRYRKLLKDEVHLLQRFSNYYIASYLGVAPPSLSRVRKEVGLQSS